MRGRSCRRTYTGTDTTRRAHDSYDLSNDADLKNAVDRLHQSTQATTLDRVRQVAVMAAGFLQRKGLPSEDRLYVREDDGRWRPADKNDAHRAQFSLRGLVEQAGFEEDSAVGYAARVVNLSRFLVGAIERGDARAAAMFGYDLGSLIAESRFKFRWEADALHGRARRDASKRQGKKNITDYNERMKPKNAAKWQPWREEARRLRALHPAWPESVVIRHLRKNLKIGSEPDDRTIRRRIKEV